MSALNLDLLSEYLDGDDNEHGLDFAATHGFLCAIAVGPAFDKWLDELFDNNQKNEIYVTPNFKEYTIELNHMKSKTDYLFMIGGVRDLNDKGTQIYIKNITFYDYDGNETVPKYN